MRASFRTYAVGADRRLHGTLGRTLEETQDFTALLSVLRCLGRVDIASTRLVRRARVVPPWPPRAPHR